MIKFRHLGIRNSFVIWILAFGIILGFILRDLLPQKPAAAKIITVRSRNLEFKSETYDQNINYGATIDISKPINVVLIDGGNEKEVETSALTVGDLLYEQKIGLAATDVVAQFIGPDPEAGQARYGAGESGNYSPHTSQFLVDGMKITIDRIVDLEVTETSEIPYEITLDQDPTTYYGIEEVVKPGIAGKKENDFLITYKNGVEIKRKLLRERVLQKPTSEQRRFGTKIEIAESKEGRASWYAFKKCLCAAHPFYEFGRYVRVTAINSGKSMIVKINDRGPELQVHPDRIIDLDSVAYKELAPLGSGTIPVRVELLRN